MEGAGEDVNEFLQRIKELGDKRNREDDERARKLEADILAGREARRARRDERARSLSPQKDSPSTPLSSMSLGSSRPGTRDGDDGGASTAAALEKLSGELANVTLTPTPATGSETPETNTLETARPTPALSWQRRPKSMHGSSSVLSRVSALSSDTESPSENGSDEKSRAQIAAGLASKEPAWFRQTQERAAGSAALRKSEEEGLGATTRTALPGMSPTGVDGNVAPKASTPEPQKGQLRSSFEPLPTGRLSRSGSLMSDRFELGHHRGSSVASNASGGRLELDTSDFTRFTHMSPSQERLSSPDRRERTPSPTKGLGGFVQSAMLKREGSINKRWSRPEQGTMASRKNSTASNAGRPAFGNRPRDSIASVDSGADDYASDVAETGNKNVLGRSRAQSTSEFLSKSSASGGPGFHIRQDSTPPASPTKTHEQKRWSPTKSSWLESALKKGTDTQQMPAPAMKPMTPLKPSERISTKSLQKPMETAPFSRPSVNLKPPALSPSTTKSSQELLKKKSMPNLSEKKLETPPKPASLSATNVLPPVEKPPINPKPKPKDPPVNFRAGLKPRPMADKGAEKEELPFLNAMSRLRSTKTQNYKAPDELKGRILEGKANLNTTGGPQKTARPDPVKENLLSAKVSLKRSESPPASPSAAPKPVHSEAKTPAPAKIETEKSSTLANRFNPNLASLLQRGPPAAGGNSSKSASSTPGSASVAVESSSNGSGSSGPLNHMTKGRARGPKRRAPTKAETSKSPDPIKSPETKAPFSRGLSPGPGASKTNSLSEPLSRKVSRQSLKEESPNVTPQKPKPAAPAKSPLLRGSSGSSLKENEKLQFPTAAEARAKSPPPVNTPSRKVASRQPLGDGSSIGTPSAENKQPTIEEEPETRGVPVKTAVVGPGPRSPTPIRLPKRNAGKEVASTAVAVTEPLRKTEHSHIENENAQLLTEFFKGPSFRAPRMDFDLMGFFACSPAIPPEKVKTLRLEVSEITGHGKLKPVAREEQHVFFDENMYLCIHRFEGGTGKAQSEVYFWSGGKVSGGAIEDAQLFAKKTARESGGKLIQLKQGRETAYFFQAIGGILITRRGSQQSSSGEHSFMLCGRNCHSGIAFDEIDMNALSLCSGFPYIISHKGAVCLWKGKGATPEEIGVARLVGFEISGGEVKEYAEGEESDGFFDAIGGFEERSSADYWHLRPSCKKYAARLFRIDLQSLAKVVEVSPFCQDDLDPGGIYIADAFFEFYIVIGAHAQPKREEFQIAMQFTQEYAVLAVSVEDRPFIPVSSIILGGAPREFKALFRFWVDEKIPTQWNPSRKPSLRLVGLREGMEAMGL